MVNVNMRCYVDVIMALFSLSVVYHNYIGSCTDVLSPDIYLLPCQYDRNDVANWTWYRPDASQTTRSLGLNGVRPWPVVG